MKVQPSGKAGFTLTEIMVVVAIIGLLVPIAIPNFIRARSSAQMNTCINNLRQIDAAKQQWALETLQAPSASPNPTDLKPFLGRGSGSVTSLFCPEDPARTMLTSYSIGNLAAIPKCLIQPSTHALK